MKKGFILILSAVVMIGIIVVAMNTYRISNPQINEKISDIRKGDRQDLELQLAHLEATHESDEIWQTEKSEEFDETEISQLPEELEPRNPESRNLELEIIPSTEPARTVPLVIDIPEIVPPLIVLETEQQVIESPVTREPTTENEERIWIQDINIPQMSTPETASQQVDLSYAEQVVQLVNEERAAVGLTALSLDKEIESAALVRARETVISFSHTRPNGSSFSSALTEGGISYRGAGENIAYGQSSPTVVVNGWMNSPGHRANILNSSFTKIGVGYYQTGGVNYWTQLFTY